MPEYQVRLFVRTTGHSSNVHGDELAYRTDRRFAGDGGRRSSSAEHFADGRYRFQHRKTVVILERAHVLRIEIEEQREV